MIFVMIVAYIIFWTPYHVFKWIEAFGSDLTKAQCMRFKNIMQLYVFFCNNNPTNFTSGFIGYTAFSTPSFTPFCRMDIAQDC